MKNSATGFLSPEENRIIENAMKFWGCSSKIEAPSRRFMFMYFLLAYWATVISSPCTPARYISMRTFSILPCTNSLSCPLIISL